MSPAPKSNTWQPSATLQELKLRADILKGIRTFFATLDMLEVETPLMCRTSVTDPFIESIPALYQSHPQTSAEQFYLQTSPEYAMKRLLAAGSGSIFQISKAFRQSENGHLHNPEFTMLEWYRIGFDHLQLIDEVDALLMTTLQTQPADKVTYQELFSTRLGIDVHDDSIEILRHAAAENHINITDEITDRDTWLNLLMTHCIEPTLGTNRPICIYNFPASQAALSRMNADNLTAARFEFYYRGMELANGFHELQDHAEQRLRFVENNKKRASLHLNEMPLDENFLSALQAGLPECAGVALGVDRLVMLASGKHCIQDVMSFDISRV